MGKIFRRDDEFLKTNNSGFFVIIFFSFFFENLTIVRNILFKIKKKNIFVICHKPINEDFTFTLHLTLYFKYSKQHIFQIFKGISKFEN